MAQEPAGGAATAAVAEPEAPARHGGDEPSPGSAAQEAAPVGGRSVRRRMPVVFDMETGDPDDVLTLLFLCSHPGVELRAVTLTPGSREQASLVRWLLREVGMEGVRLGAQEWPRNTDKKCIQGRFYESFGHLKTSDADVEPADRVLVECCDEAATLLTGGPLHNLGQVLSWPDFQLGRWVAQGGFAGEGVVPPELQMGKFVGKLTCPTWNFNGNMPAAEAALASPRIGRRVLVSKNVCHRVVYDAELHDAVGAAAAEAATQRGGQRAAALQLLHRAMERYGPGKKLHDPLALAVVLEESVCSLSEVRVFRHARRSEWGSELLEGTNTWISVDYSDAAFRAALLAAGPRAACVAGGAVAAARDGPRGFDDASGAAGGKRGKRWKKRP